MSSSITLSDLRSFAVSRSLFRPTTLVRAIERLGFVQADPIRAPARAQDLTLRHRVKGYHAGDLERRYVALGIEEDFLVNYGFMPRATQVLMHPRSGSAVAVRGKKAQSLLEFVRAREAVHPREVDEHFAHGSVTNYWGGSSSATTHLLTRLHYRGALRVASRAGGVRLYAVHAHEPGPSDMAGRRASLDRLVDIVVRVYAPLPTSSLAWFVNRLRYAVPQWTGDLKRALERAKARLAHARVGQVDWYWPAGSLRRAAHPTAPYASSRRSIPSSGIGAGSSCSGDGAIASKPTRPRPNENLAITPFRCCGAIASSAGAISQSSMARCGRRSDTSTAVRRVSRDSAAS